MHAKLSSRRHTNVPIRICDNATLRRNCFNGLHKTKEHPQFASFLHLDLMLKSKKPIICRIDVPVKHNEPATKSPVFFETTQNHNMPRSAAKLKMCYCVGCRGVDKRSARDIPKCIKFDFQLSSWSCLMRPCYVTKSSHRSKHHEVFNRRKKTDKLTSFRRSCNLGFQWSSRHRGRA